MEAISSLAPEQVSHRRAEDPLFNEDEDLALIYEGRKFYLESLDGSRVVVASDALGMRPASWVTPPSSNRKRVARPPAPSRLTSSLKAQCCKHPRGEAALQGRSPRVVQDAQAEVMGAGESAPPITR